MSLSLVQYVRLLTSPAVVGPPLRALRKMRAMGIRRLPSDVYDMKSGRLRAARMRAFMKNWLHGERLTRHRGQWVLNSFLPPFPGAAYERMFDNMFSGRHLSPVSAFLAVTARCPYSCRHCSLAGRRADGDLATGDWMNAIRQLHALGVSVIGFTGGEPCLREDLPALVKAASEGGAATILFTSGHGLENGLVGRLKSVGLWSVCVSLDSDTPELHEARRGAGTFAIAIGAIQRARAAGFYTMAGAVASPEFVEGQRHAKIHRLLSTLGAHEFRIVEPMPCGRMTGCTAAQLLAPGQVAELRRFHVETNRRGRGPTVCAFNHIESPEIFGCGAGTQHLFIEPSGVVCPCDFTPLGFGNIRDTPLADIWRRMNLAMGDNPRSRCFVQTHKALIERHAAEGFPLSPAASEAVCAEAGAEPLPGYFALVTGSAISGQPKGHGT